MMKYIIIIQENSNFVNIANFKILCYNFDKIPRCIALCLYKVRVSEKKRYFLNFCVQH